MNRLRIAFVATALLFTGLSFATRVQPMNLASLVKRSERVVEAKCTLIEYDSVKSSGGTLDIPVVRYTFEVIDSLRGVSGDKLVISQFGEFQDGRHFFADAHQIGIPEYKVGAHVLLFLGPDSATTGLTVPTGLQHGIFDVQEQRAKSRVGNTFIMFGLKDALQGTRHAALVDPVRMKRHEFEGMDLEALKALVRDMIRGEVKAPTFEELQK